MAHYAEKEWDHFLHATDVGRALDHVGRIFGGFVTEAESTIKGIWDLNPLRAVVDPKGFWHSVSGALEHLEALTGLDGEHKAEESWKDLGKGIVHWDEWSTDPFTAAGESRFRRSDGAPSGRRVVEAVQARPPRGGCCRGAQGISRPERPADCQTRRRTTTRHSATNRHGAKRRKVGSPSPRPQARTRCRLTGSPNRRVRPPRNRQRVHASKPMVDPASQRAHAPSLLDLGPAAGPSSPATAVRASSCVGQQPDTYRNRQAMTITDR